MFNEEVYQQLVARKEQERKQQEFTDLCKEYRVCPKCGGSLRREVFDDWFICEKCKYAPFTAYSLCDRE